MYIRILTVASVVLTMVACESKPEAPPETTPPRAEGETKPETPENTKDKGAKWKIVYSGDLEGTVEGGILTAQTNPQFAMVRGSTMKKSKDAKVRSKLRAEISDGGDRVKFSTVLPDGTECETDATTMRETKAVVKDADAKTYSADIEGALVCGDDKSKRITFQATMTR